MLSAPNGPFDSWNSGYDILENTHIMRGGEMKLHSLLTSTKSVWEYEAGAQRKARIFIAVCSVLLIAWGFFTGCTVSDHGSSSENLTPLREVEAGLLRDMQPGVLHNEKCTDFYKYLIDNETIQSTFDIYQDVEEAYNAIGDIAEAKYGYEWPEYEEKEAQMKRVSEWGFSPYIHDAVSNNMDPDVFDDLCKSYLEDHPDEMIETMSICSASYYLFYNGLPGQVSQVGILV